MTIAATIGFDDAGGDLWDAAIVGAGPAGSLLAYQLARRGRKVLLLDKSSFPRTKVCGCCLSGLALSTLKEVGLGDLPARQGAVPLRSVRLGMNGNTATLKLPGGVSLSRHRFDAALIEKSIQAGAHFLPEARVSGLTAEENRCVVEVRQGQRTLSISGRIAIAADGLNGRLGIADPDSEVVCRPGSRIGAGAIAPEAPAFFQPGTVYMACGRAGYVGLVRLEDGQLDLGAALDPEAVRAGGLAKVAGDILADTGWPAIDGLAELPWRGTPALTRQRLAQASRRLFAVGDATGYVEPFTGEGMGWALSSARALTGIVDRAIERWDDRLIGEWQAAHRRSVGRRQHLCRWMARLLRSPRLTGLLIRILKQAPVLARPYVHRLNRSHT